MIPVGLRVGVHGGVNEGFASLTFGPVVIWGSAAQKTKADSLRE
jgi:hypothetical protein